MTTQEITPKLCECGCGNPAPIARKTSTRYGHVKGQPVRFISGHKNKKAIEELFWPKVDRREPNECWLWLGPPNNSGYGSCFDGVRSRGAHCISWEIHYGPIPKGKNVCHNCPDGDNSLCVNPAHLWLGTQATNLQDMSKKGRASTVGFLGESHPGHKLSNQDIIDIRKMWAQGAKQHEIRKRFGTTRTNISDIVRGKTWKHIT